MATLRFLLKRFAAQRLLGLAVVVTLAFSIGVLVAGPIYADAARSAILSSAIQSAAVTVANVRIQAFGNGDFPYAEADASITSETRSLPVGKEVRQGLTTVRLNGADGPSVPLLFRDGAEDHLTFKGEPPGPGEIALAQNSPQTRGVQHRRPGDAGRSGRGCDRAHGERHVPAARSERIRSGSDRGARSLPPTPPRCNRSWSHAPPRCRSAARSG